MDREPLHNRIIREIIAMVASGSYTDGQRLPAERSLCKQFDVSRGTLRKGLSKLEELGVVSIKPNSGVYVHSVSPARLPGSFLPPDFERVSLGDIIEARKAIETAAIELACGRIRPGDLKALKALLEKMASAIDDLSRFLESDMAFHQRIVRASGNIVLVTAFEAIYEYHRFSSIFTSQQRSEERLALDYHRSLLDALEKGDAKACRGILIKHLDAMKKYGRDSRRATAPPHRRVRSKIA